MTISLILVLSVFGLLIALYYARQVSQIPLTQGISDSAEAERLRKIHGAISKGAMAFLTQEYRYMIYFMVAFAVLISFLVDDPHTANLNEGMYTALSFLLGAGVSMISGFIGMKIATIGNARTTVSAKTSISKAFQVALHSGAVMGFGLVGLAVRVDRRVSDVAGLATFWSRDTHLNGSHGWLWSGRFFDCVVRSCRRWNLHQGSRRWSGPGWEGGAGNSGGRSSQPSGHRR